MDQSLSIRPLRPTRVGQNRTRLSLAQPFGPPEHPLSGGERGQSTLLNILFIP